MKELIQQLQAKATGEHVHTRNKAAFYLEKLGANNPHRAELERLVRAALATDQWSDLKKHMANWW